MRDEFSIERWRQLGWQHPFWELLRFYCSLRGGGQQAFLAELASSGGEGNKWWDLLGFDKDSARLVLDYCAEREKLIEVALKSLRTEDEAKEYCTRHGITWGTTPTRNTDHHQSSKTLVATVGTIARKVCEASNVTLDVDPTRRCVWLIDNHLHVTARNLDGAIPGLRDPYVVWEIKEYWGVTHGGSKMSDAVYECHLVGREIREFEKKANHRISHIVFVDGKQQWHKRKSDLARFIDLHNQGLIDQLFIGRTIEQEWEPILTRILKERAKR